MDEFKFIPPNDKENKSTPIRNKPKINSHLTPILNTPNGSKVNHPFIKNLITNRYNSQINDDIFQEKESTPNIGAFSPDFVGTLFPKEINTSHLQLKCFDKLYQKYRHYLNVKSSQILIDESIAPSPDSAIGSSIQTTRSSLSEMSNFSNSRFTNNTPPSQFKWNRKEYRSDNFDQASLNIDYSNELDECSDDELINSRNLESTQIFNNSTRLADNKSMRRFSAIRTNNHQNCDDNDSFSNLNSRKRRRVSPVANDTSISSILRDSGLDDLENSFSSKQRIMKISVMDSDMDVSYLSSSSSSFQQQFLRSSPSFHWNFAMEADMNLSPIKSDIGDKFRMFPTIDLSPIKSNPNDDENDFL